MVDVQKKRKNYAGKKPELLRTAIARNVEGQKRTGCSALGTSLSGKPRTHKINTPTQFTIVKRNITKIETKRWREEKIFDHGTMPGLFHSSGKRFHARCDLFDTNEPISLTYPILSIDIVFLLALLRVESNFSEMFKPIPSKVFIAFLSIRSPWK